MFLAEPLCHAQNILTDGSFSTTTSINTFTTDPPTPGIWFSWTNNDNAVNANASVVDGVCNYQIINSGIYTSDVQLAQWGFPLTQGHSYQLTFDVKANANRSFGVFLGEDGGGWTNLNANNYSQLATTDWQTITINFDATSVFAYHKLSFELGKANINMYFDNVDLEDMGLYPITVGIIGTSLSGWDVDVDMNTTDNINYTLSSYPLTSGQVKFRQDNAWYINWGNNTFPTGIGYQDGPDIPVLTYGNYDITFNRETGEYFFTCVSNCPANIGIIGSAVLPYLDWKTDVNMSTADGITYKLSNYTFTDGEAKFRQDDSWGLNWGSSDFPSGKAVLNGNNIDIKAGTYNVLFNIITGEYSFTVPNISILGSGLNGWDEDIDMYTNDGIKYFLDNYSFTDGEVKFRAENSWEISWGDYTFPGGMAYLYGPNIPVMAGTYDVVFNRITGAYFFTATSCPIAGIKCPDNIYVSNTPSLCGAYVFFPGITAAANCGGPGITIEQTEGLPSGSKFPVGITKNTYELTNKSGNTATCSFYINVYDSEPPVITQGSNNIVPLWPPDHQMVNVPVNYSTSDNCGTVISELYVYSNEPISGLESGDKQPDWEIVDNHNVLLRAERSSKGTGREYYIYIVCHDESWNFSFQLITVTVPHDQGIKIANSGDTNQSANGISIGNNSLNAKVWPNPSNSYFNVEVSSSAKEKVILSIFDNSGRLISSLDASSTHSSKFGETLNPGIYFVIVKQGNDFCTLKIVKQ